MNRLIRLIIKKGNLSTSLNIDEVPTLYLPKIGYLVVQPVATNGAVLMRLQELPQYKHQFGKMLYQKFLKTL